MAFLHENLRFNSILETIAEQKLIDIKMVEKDYWIMHSLWGLQNLKFDFYLKGGTSLSKGYNAVERFSEDLDVMIIPPADIDVKYGKNHDKDIHRQSRKDYFDWLLSQINISGIAEVKYDDSVTHDGKYRNADILLKYQSVSPDQHVKIKKEILLEIGFDQVDPFTPKDISSWAYDFAKLANLDLQDNRAIGVRCYNPEYTFVEKLSAISKKFRQYQETGARDRNFLRHYYDIFMLLKRSDVQKFIGSKKYLEHKTKKFSKKDEFDLTKNEAFIISDEATMEFFTKEHNTNSSLHYDQKFPNFKEILEGIGKYLPKM